jgi:hypothetical protein
VTTTGEKARAVKARYQGLCRGCGAYTQLRNGKGDAYAYCKACHPGAIERRWTRERVVAAMVDWRRRYGRLPSSYDWSRTHARRRGGEALERLARGSGGRRASSPLCGGAGRRRAVRLVQHRAGAGRGLMPASRAKPMIGHGAHLCAQSPEIRRKSEGLTWLVAIDKTGA